jgi:hypothetical protein
LKIEDLPDFSQTAGEYRVKIVGILNESKKPAAAELSAAAGFCRKRRVF